MRETLDLSKFTIIVTTRCNLKCRLCCEYVPQNKPFSDITVQECGEILGAAFTVADHITTLHLSGGGEPFLHPKLGEMVELCMKYEDQFERLMLFTNSTVIPSESLLKMLEQYREKIVVQVSHYGVYPEKEQEVLETIEKTGVTVKFQKYYGENQTHGGWVDFGAWEDHGRQETELSDVFRGCAVTSQMNGNWRTRDGKVFWCSRAQRGTELGLLPDCKEDYVDLLDESSAEEKREKFRKIMKSDYMQACRYCSGDAGTTDTAKRFCAAEQREV